MFPTSNSPYCVLSLEAEQEGGCEVADVLDADSADVGVGVPGRVQVTCDWSVSIILDSDELVTVGQGYQEPNHWENEPGQVEGSAEPEQRPRPGQVNHWGEEVFQVST